MADSHVISALRTKRAELSGEIKELERRVKDRRAKLAHVDETIRLFDPDIDPGEIAPKRTYNRRGYFEAGELARFVQEYMRDAAGPVACSQITQAALTAKGLPTERSHVRDTIGSLVLSVLRSMAKRGAVAKVGEGSGTRWALTERN
jgi:chromosome segregation and condensation protein ScpB